MTAQRVDRHDPQSRCQRTGCGHQRAVHTGRHFGSSWSVCTEAGCPCWSFEDQPTDNPQVDNRVDNPLDVVTRRDDPADLDVVSMRAADADQLVEQSWLRGLTSGRSQGWNDALEAALQLIRTYRDGHGYGTREYRAREQERTRIISQLETLKR